MPKKRARAKSAAKPKIAGTKPVPAPAPPPQNYAFVVNPMRLPVDAFEVAPGHTLRRATAEEIAEIREAVGRLAPMPIMYGHLWEQAWPPAGKVVRLPEEQWRYFVIS